MALSGINNYLVTTPLHIHIKSEEKKRDFRVSSSVTKTVSIREKFKLPAVFVQIQPFLGLKEPEMLLPIVVESPNFAYRYPSDLRGISI